MIFSLMLVASLLVDDPDTVKSEKPVTLLAGRMYWERGEGGWGLYQGVVGGKTPNDFQAGWLSDDGKYWRLRRGDKGDKDKWERDIMPFEPPDGWVGIVKYFEPGGLRLHTVNGLYELKLKDESAAEIRRITKAFHGKEVRIKGGLSIWTKDDKTRFVIWVKDIKENK